MEAIFKEIIHKDSKILLALSGGPDSMYLLHRLVEYRREVPFLLEAAHLHHGLRKEADEDLAFVRAICKQWNVTLYEKQMQVADYGKEHKMGVEEAGRLLRYKFFRECKREGGLIALAHHLDDQVETMLLRLIRGTGLKGMAGMNVLEGDLFRPLLSMTKEAILSALAEKNIPYVLDETNFEPTYSRNRLRLSIVPEMKAINPAFDRVMASFRMMAEEDESYLSKEAIKLYAALAREDNGSVFFDEAIFRAPDALRRRAFRLGIEKVRGHVKNISYEHIAAIDELEHTQTGKGLDLPGLRVEKSYGTVAFFIPEEESKIEAEAKLVDGKAEFMGHRFYLGDGEDFIYVKDPADVVIRSRRPGDVIRLNVGRKKVKDVFIDAKIERRRRDRWPVVTEAGEVVWVVGLRKAERQEEKSWQKLAWIPLNKM